MRATRKASDYPAYRKRAEEISSYRRLIRFLFRGKVWLVRNDDIIVGILGSWRIKALMIVQAYHPSGQTTSSSSGHRHARRETCQSGIAPSQMPDALRGTWALHAMIS